MHYDWSAHDAGAAFSSSLYTPTTTTGQISGATSLVIGSATGYGTTGGVWVAGNGSGQGWEYERFTARSSTTLTVVRESTTDREHNGAHSSGASVYQFYPVTTNGGELTISEQADENVTTITWTATISGVRAPRHVLRNGHIVVVTTSTDGGSYTIALVGFVDNPTISDDYKSNSEWTLNIVSSAQIVAEVDARGVRIGEADIADAGSATSTTELVLAYNERHNGDFTAASPEFSAGSAIDNELKTLWIAEHFTGTDYWSNAPNSDPENGYDLAFAHIYINPPTAAGPNARFIELRVRSSTNVRGFALNSANGGGVEIWIFNGPGDVEDGGSIFLVEDEDTFARLNPLAQSAAIYENKAFFAHIEATGGEFWLRLGELNIWQSRVRWGDGNGYVQHEDAPDRDWDGATVTAPSTGQTMRYIWTHSTGDAADYWETDMVCHAGYNIDDDDPIWIMVTLPGLGLKLAEDITSSVPGNSGTLYINGPDDKYSTDGLPASGTLFIGDEQIAYSSKSSAGYVTLASSGARGAGGTTAAAHNKDDEVFIMDGSVATDAYLIESIGWQRSAGTIYPKHITLFTTNMVENVRTPDQDDYLDDWTAIVTLTTNTDSYHTAGSINARVRHLLYEIYSMTTDPARPRINEINAIVDSSLHNPDMWLDTNTTAGDLIQQILESAGIWPGAIAHSGTSQLVSTVTADDNAWTVVADIAEYAACRVTVGRDSKFTIAADTFWTGTPSIATTWNRTSAVSINPAWRKVTPVSQVILPWRAPSGEDNGKIYYPASPERGSKLELPERLYANSTAATSAARRLYFMRLYPTEVMVTATDDVSDKRPGEAHQVYWKLYDDSVAIDRNTAVMSAEHTLKDGYWSSTFRLIQYGHESNF